MPKPRHAVLLLLALLPQLAAATATGETPHCAVQTEVVDPAGHAVEGAVVRLLPDRRPDADRRATTGGDGIACLPDVPAGEHQVLVVADGFGVFDARTTKEVDAPLALRVELTPAFGEEVVVTGTRTAKRLAEVPVHVQRISRESIEDAQARTLADAIELTPGVRLESNCQNCNFTQVRLLGLEGPYSQILVDGQPTVSSLAHVYGIEQFPARMLDSVEVVKGGGAAIYGAGAVGGVINLIPHSPMHTHATVESRYLETGGEPGYSASGLAEWSPRDRRTGVIVLGQVDEIEPSDRDGDGFSEVASRELETFALRMEHFTLGDDARLHAEANFTAAERRGGDLPRFHLEPHETALTEEISTRRVGLGVGWLHTVSSRWDYRVSASLAETRRDSYYGAGFDPNAYGETENPLWMIDAQANLYRERSTITAGVQYSDEDLVDRQPGYGREIDETKTNLGVYLQEDRQIGDRTTLVYGLRADEHSALGEPVVSPRLALMIAPRDDVTLRMSAARGFRAPEVFDEDLHIELAAGAARVVVPATDLVEERSEAFLASLEWSPSFGRRGTASLEAAAFRTDLDDLFDVVERDDPSTPEQTEFVRVNAAGARVEGVELAASVRWGSRLTAQLGFVAQSSRFDQPEPDFGSSVFFRTPDQHGTLNLRWSLPQQIDLFLGARYTGPMVAPHYAGFIAEDRLERTPSFLEWDLNLSRSFLVRGRDLEVTVGAKNLTDEFQEDLDRGPDRDSNYVYGPRFPRSYTVGLKVDL